MTDMGRNKNTSDLGAKHSVSLPSFLSPETQIQTILAKVPILAVVDLPASLALLESTPESKPTNHAVESVPHMERALKGLADGSRIYHGRLVTCP